VETYTADLDDNRRAGGAVASPALAQSLCGLRPKHSKDRCRHRLLSVVPVVDIRVEDGYAARCLLCGSSGPVRRNRGAARMVLLEQMVCDDTSPRQRMHLRDAAPNLLALREGS